MFTVLWSPTASSDFAILALSHIDRSTEIDEAGDDIDDKLQIAPTVHGQHISEGLWRIASGPLAALYSIDGNEVAVDAMRWIG